MKLASVFREYESNFIYSRSIESIKLSIMIAELVRHTLDHIKIIRQSGKDRLEGSSLRDVDDFLGKSFHFCTYPRYLWRTLVTTSEALIVGPLTSSSNISEFSPDLYDVGYII